MSNFLVSWIMSVKPEGSKRTNTQREREVGGRCCEAETLEEEKLIRRKKRGKEVRTV